MRRVVSLHYVNVARGQAAGRFGHLLGIAAGRRNSTRGPTQPRQLSHRSRDAVPPTIASARIRDRPVESRVNYIGPMTERPRYYADDGSRDNLTLDPRTIRVDNARLWVRPSSLAHEGFALVPHRSDVS